MNKWVKPIRTAIQSTIALIPVVPLLAPALGLSVTVGVGAALVSVASLLSRLMQIPAVEALLAKAGIHTPTP